MHHALDSLKVQQNRAKELTSIQPCAPVAIEEHTERSASTNNAVDPSN